MSGFVTLPPFLEESPEDNIIDAPELTSMRQNNRAVGNASGLLPTTGVASLPGKNIYPASALVYLEPAVGAVAGAVLARYWLDGSFPTTEKGFPLRANEKVLIEGRFDVQNVRFISVDGRAHALQIQYFNY